MLDAGEEDPAHLRAIPVPCNITFNLFKALFSHSIPHFFFSFSQTQFMCVSKAKVVLSVVVCFFPSLTLSGQGQVKVAMGLNAQQTHGKGRVPSSFPFFFFLILFQR